MNSSLLSFCVSDAQLIAGFNGDVKRDWGASPTSTRSVCLDTDTARTEYATIMFTLMEDTLYHSFDSLLRNSEKSKIHIEKSLIFWYNSHCRAVA